MKLRTLLSISLMPAVATAMSMGAETQSAPPTDREAPAAAAGSGRFIAYNVQFGCRGTAEEIGDMLKRWNPDVVALNEVPGGDWTDRVARRSGLAYSYVGTISSADMMGILNANGTEGGYFKGKCPKDIEFKPNKFKCVLSRTPLTETREVPISGHGWQPASAVRAETIVKGRPLVIYSLHIAGDRAKPEGAQAADLAGRILAKEAAANTVVMGRPNEGVIDHILFKCPKTARAIQGGIIELNQPLSDHKPVWGDIRFAAPGETSSASPVECRDPDGKPATPNFPFLLKLTIHLPAS